jgi:hypothetical protein
MWKSYLQILEKVISFKFVIPKILKSATVFLHLSLLGPVWRRYFFEFQKNTRVLKKLLWFTLFYNPNKGSHLSVPLLYLLINTFCPEYWCQTAGCSGKERQHLQLESHFRWQEVCMSEKLVRVPFLYICCYYAYTQKWWTELHLCSFIFGKIKKSSTHCDGTMKSLDMLICKFLWILIEVKAVEWFNEIFSMDCA